MHGLPEACVPQPATNNHSPTFKHAIFWGNLLGQNHGQQYAMENATNIGILAFDRGGKWDATRRKPETKHSRLTGQRLVHRKTVVMAHV